jgi:2-iminobutanoate/2-iminopropanoate deaminase
LSSSKFYMLKSAPEPVAPFSHAVETDGWVQLTGQMPTDPDDSSKPLPVGIEGQTCRVMDNLVLVLEGVELGLENVTSVRVYLTDFDRDYQAMNRIYATYFNLDRRPARTCVGVTTLACGALVEIDMTAWRP